MLDDALNFFRGLLDECQKAEAELNEARSTIVLREKSNDCIQEALDIARAELVQAKKDYDWMMAQHDVWKACAFKEAELKSGFKAELDALKPLLDIRPEVVAFARLMEDRLQVNEHKGGWKNCDVNWLLDRLRMETSELSDELNTHDYIWVDKEAADVANFAMMITDVTGRLSYRAREGKEKP